MSKQDEQGEDVSPMAQVAMELTNVSALVAEQAAEIERLKTGGGILIVGDPSKLFAALAAAQGEFPPIERTKTVRVSMKAGGSYTFDYAPLDQVQKVCAPVLAKHGICVLQPFSDGEPYQLVTIMAGHGARIESRVTLSKAEDIKAQGSAITYMRRYTYQAMIGVTTETDDDGNAGSGDKAEVSNRPKAQAKPEPSKSASPSQSKPAEKASPPAASSSSMNAIQMAKAKSLFDEFLGEGYTTDQTESLCQEFVGKPLPKARTDWTGEDAEKLIVGLQGKIAAQGAA